MDLLSDLSEALRPFSDLQSMSLSSSPIGGIAVAVCVTRFLPLMGYRGNAFPLRGDSFSIIRQKGHAIYMYLKSQKHPEEFSLCFPPRRCLGLLPGGGGYHGNPKTF